MHQTFLVEGEKSVREALQASLKIEQILCTEVFYQENDYLIHSRGVDCEVITPELLAQLSSLTSNDSALAILPFFEEKILYWEEGEYILLLDNIQDPGNLGAILRIADWYGIHKIIASPDSVDLYNPKAIAASMGSFMRVKMMYTLLREYFRQCDSMPVYGALLTGQNIHEVNFDSKGGAILLGNESQGISPNLHASIRHKITIPRFGQAESLNVAMATAVICDNLRRGLSQ
ncbi:MAG: RNA methyltransferase [Microscillaceae bacterium]|nr:RNA methyltransferase [Microscillaceae bacterium]